MIGANVQMADYDLGRLMDSVEYVDNDTTLDATELPLPVPIAGF